MKSRTGYIITGASLIYISTAFIIPFPTEVLSVFIAQVFFGELSIINLGKATILLYVIGLLTLIFGLYLIHESKQEVKIKNIRE